MSRWPIDGRCPWCNGTGIAVVEGVPIGCACAPDLTSSEALAWIQVAEGNR